MATRLCPFCAEEIQAAAIKCKHCHEMLGKLDRTPSYYKPTGMIFAFFCFGPFMLPLIWLNPKLDTRQRIIATAVVIGITAPLVWAVVRAVSSILTYYQQLSQLY